jgi:hypothetical protein
MIMQRNPSADNIKLDYTVRISVKPSESNFFFVWTVMATGTQDICPGRNSIKRECVTG